MKFAKAFFKKPWLIITICLIITGFLGFFIKDLQIDNSVRQFLHIIGAMRGRGCHVHRR